MSFRQNGQHRYGHVPPAQYGGQATQEVSLGLQRQSSFDNGDDVAFFDPANERRPSLQPPMNSSGSGRSQDASPGDELFFGGPSPDSRPPPRPPYVNSSAALAGYQHQYQPASVLATSATPVAPTYNPQQFARTYSQMQTSTTPYNPQLYTQNSPNQQHQPYVPAAYQPQASLQRQQTMPSYSQTSGYGAPPVQQAPQQPVYWAPPMQYGAPLPAVPSRAHAQQIYEQPLQNPPYPQPGSAPLPPRQSAYSPPVPSSPYQTNGVYPSADFRISSASPQYSQYAQVPASPHQYQPQAPISAPNAYAQSSEDSNSFSTRISRSSSHATNPLPSPPAPEESSNTLQRHPTLRPLPTAPIDEDSDSWDDDRVDAEARAQEQIYQDIEAAVSGGISQPRNSYSQTTVSHGGDLLDDELSDLHRFDSRATTLNPTRTASVSTLSQNPHVSNYTYESESDAEAAAGLEAMRLADEQDSKRGSNNFGLYSSQPKPQDTSQEGTSDSDYANFDMGLYGGDYIGQMSYRYGDNFNANTGHSSEMDDQSGPLPTSNDLHRVDGHVPAPGLGGMTDYTFPGDTTIHPFPAFDSRDESFGVGGLQRPSSANHRLSFDEGDERTSLGSRYADSRLSGRSGSESPSRDDIPEMFYHPGLGTSRPLPPVPFLYDSRTPQLGAAGSYRNAQYQQESTRQYHTPESPDAYQSHDLLSPSGHPTRHSSLLSHPSTPQVDLPVRSRTDAEERQAKQRALRQQSSAGPGMDGFDPATPQTAMSLDLPALPLSRRRKISASGLRSADFKKCKEPWALSGVAEWIREMCGGENGEGETDLREKTIAECLVMLFTHKVPTMNTTDAELLSESVVNTMFKNDLLVRDEEWVKFGNGAMSGVMWQLTGTGCYAPRLHEQEIHGRCYSHHCSRTLKKINLHSQSLEPAKKAEEWYVYFKLTKEQLENADKKEIQRQNNLHEIVTTEENYLVRLNVLRVLYRDELQSWQPPIIAPSKLPKFISQVFGKVEAIKKANEDYLLAQLKYRQQEQGPWIVGFSDIFREWIRKARQPYLEYAAGFPYANHMVRKEAERNVLFRQFLDQTRDNKLSDRLDWGTYLHAPVKRLAGYTLLLKEVLKHSIVDTEEKANLVLAIDEINTVTLECDAKVAESSKKVEMIDLNSKLYLRPGMERVELNLDHLGRQLIFKGDLQRAGTNRFAWLETHAILFDNYLVLAKTLFPRDNIGSGRKKEVYDVSKLPIPMQLLVLESTNDEAVQKSSVKGLATVTTVNRPTDRPGNLEHSNTNNSVATMSSLNKIVNTTNLENDAKAMYPFRVKHLGKSEVYTLYAPTLQNRQDWCEKIIEAKERYAASLFSQNAEPFRLKVLADTAFAYDASLQMSRGPGIRIRGTPLDRSLREMEREYGGVRPGPVCRAMVNCATTFTCYGKSMIAVGTDYGVYTTEITNSRGWTRAIQISRVTQISVLEDFSICLIIADKALIAYQLDAIAPASSFPAPQNDSTRRAPQKLSGTKDVGFFETARMKDRTLVFYKKREGLHSTFKVLEPIFQKSTEKKSKLFGRGRLGGSTEFFREFDEFYVPSECFSINLFHTYIAISTPKSFELLTLDKKVPMSIPELRSPSIAHLAARLSGQKPLGMFRLSDSEFLLCYEECGVWVDKHGEVSRGVVEEFVGKAKSAAMYGAYLVLFDNDFVEVRNAQNGRLRQIIAGRDVRCLDYGGEKGEGREKTLKVAMAHPEVGGMQLVLELCLNEGQREEGPQIGR